MMTKKQWGVMMHKSAREYERFYATFYLRIFDGTDFFGFLMDFSEEGMMVMTETKIDRGASYRLSMAIPEIKDSDDAMDDRRMIAFDAQCRWSRKDDMDGEFFINGFKCTGIDASDRERLITLITGFQAGEE